MTRKSEARKVARRRAHAAGAKRDEHSEPVPQPRWFARVARSSRVRWLSACALSVVAGAAVSTTLSPQEDPTWTRIAGAFFAAIGVATLWLVTRWRLRLGTATAVAAVSIVWGIAVGSLALAVPQCPGAYDEGRCGVSEVATYASIGMLMPVSFALLALLPLGAVWLAWKAGRIFATRDERVAARRNKIGSRRRAGKDHAKEAAQSGHSAKSVSAKPPAGKRRASAS